MGLPPQRLGLQPRENFTLWKNEKLVRAGAAKATHLFPSDHRLTQHTVSGLGTWYYDCDHVGLNSSSRQGNINCFMEQRLFTGLLCACCYMHGFNMLLLTCLTLYALQSRITQVGTRHPEKVGSQTGTSSSIATQPTCSWLPSSQIMGITWWGGNIFPGEEGGLGRPWPR